MTLNNDPNLTPATDQGILATGAEAGAKRQQQMGKPDFGTRTARQVSTLVWAGAEVAAELRDNTAVRRDQQDVLTAIATASARQAEAAERAAAAAERTARATHVQTIIALYNAPAQVFPAGVLEQLKSQLGITAQPVAQRPVAQQPAPQPPAVLPAPVPEYDEFV